MSYQKVVNFAVDLYMDAGDATLALSLQGAEGVSTRGRRPAPLRL